MPRKRNKKVEVPETPVTPPIEGQPAETPPPEPVTLIPPQEVIRQGDIGTPEAREALRLAVATVRPDIIATTANRNGHEQDAKVRYRGSKRQIDLTGAEAHLFAHSRALVLALLDMVDAMTAMRELDQKLIDSLKAEAAKLNEQLNAAKAEAETLKAVVAGLGSELAEVKANLAARTAAWADAEAELAKAAGELAGYKTEAKDADNTIEVPAQAAIEA